MRKKLPLPAETNVLTSSRRRCCLCYGLHRDTSIKTGQITHLNHDHNNHSSDNLTWMCLLHHNEYDSTSSQCKNYTIGEVKSYIRELDAYIRKEFSIVEDVAKLHPLRHINTEQPESIADDQPRLLRECNAEVSGV